MPTGRPRTKRYNSEYKSHYKKFDSRRPNTVKGELTRSIIPQDVQSISSTPRAGLQSTQLGIIHEPPLQRKRIVPYEKNHNIFPTGTIKELADREWLDVDKTSRTDQAGAPPTRHKQSHSKVKTSNVPHRTESPILAAEKKLIIRNTAEKPSGYHYVPDGIKKRTTYDQDFGVNGRRSKTTNRNRVEKSPIRDKKTKLVIGGKKTGITPDRMAPAGIRTMTSIGDKRLIQPSDNSEYLRSPERENARVFDSEYSSRFKYIDGAWIESPEYQGCPSPVKNKLDWYKEAITRRNEAYGYAKQARGTHFSREELDRQNRLNAQYDDHDDSFSSVSEPSVSHSSKKNKRTNGNARKERRSENRMGESFDKNDRPPPRREAWVKRPASPVESDRSFSTMYSGTTETTADQFFLERGRSPTPELRETGQARRHHYDMTTNILNEKLRKSLTFSDEKKKDHVNGYHRQTAGSSVRSQDGSYVPRHREDDMMSEVSMASWASTASKTLEKAKERRDNFWQKQNGQYET